MVSVAVWQKVVLEAFTHSEFRFVVPADWHDDGFGLWLL